MANLYVFSIDQVELEFEVYNSFVKTVDVNHLSGRGDFYVS